MSTLAMLAAESGQILAAAPQKGPAGSIGSSLLVTLVLGAMIVYAKKHKGWDVIQMVMGGVFVLCLMSSPLSGTVSWIPGTITGTFDSIFGALGSLG